MKSLRSILCWVFAAVMAVTVVADEPPAPRADFARGMTISCRGNGPGEWDSPAMGKAIASVKALGCDWISFHPYARIGNDASVRHRNRADDPSVIEPIAEAKRQGVKVLLKPHLAYWGSKFSWRGEIRFETEAEWQRFFAGYTDFIVHQAELAEAAGAHAFCVGTELDATAHRQAEWRAVIAAVRKVYKGVLTYAANWDTYPRVPFWDAVDVIGIQAYFPISKADDPSEAQLEAGWDRVLAELRRFSAKQHKPIALTELGYPLSPVAAAEPWTHTGRAPASEAAHGLKLRAMRVALRKIEAEPAIVGVMLWKWFATDRDGSHDFLLQYDAMRAVLREAWVTPGH